MPCLPYYTNKVAKKAVVKSQFNYCPLVRMFCSRTSNNMINRVHEWALRVILGDDLSDFESLLQNNKDIRSNHKNIQSLRVEMFKFQNELAPPIMDSMFKRRNQPNNLRNFQEFLTERKRIVHHGLETLSYRSPQLWSLLPEKIRPLAFESSFSVNRRIYDFVSDITAFCLDIKQEFFIFHCFT